jgi:tetratricopeptide (TPR) repeat protein
MTTAGFHPDVPMFSALFAKDLSQVNPDDLLDWYLNHSYQPESPMEVAIKSYHEVGHLNHALALALHYPHLAAARNLMRESEESALAYFQSVVDLDPSDRNGNYALGIALIELNRGLEATPYLEKALTQARARDQASPQVNQIEQLLRCIVEGTPG